MFPCLALQKVKAENFHLDIKTAPSVGTELFLL